MSSLKSAGKTYVITGDAPYVAWPDTGGVMLTDEDLAWHDWKVGWYINCNPIITVDIGADITLDYCRFMTQIWNPAGIPGPSQVVILGKVDGGSTYATLGTFNSTTYFPNTNNYPSGAWSLDLDVSGNYRYVQFDFNNGGAGLSLTEVEVYGDDIIAATTQSVNYLKGRRNRWDYSGVSVG